MDLCIYHGGCTDGVAAAWAVHRAIGTDVELHPGVYQQEPPWELIENADGPIYLVDFSYKADVMREIAGLANGDVIVLDHHDTARADLEPLLADGTLGGEFDMTRSGALMAWDYFHPGEQRPPLLGVIDARDRWAQDEHPMPNEDIEAITMRVRCLPHTDPIDLDQWDVAMSTPLETLKTDGRAIHIYYRLRVEDLKKLARPVTVGLFDNVPCVNAPWYFASDVAGELAAQAECGWAFCWWQNSDGSFTTSLRSRGGDPHVGEIAKQYGGGGHPGAAGFKCSRPPWYPFLSRSGPL